MSGLLDNMTYIWLIAVIILLVIEAATVGLTIIWFAAGSLTAMIFSIFGAPPWMQIAAFAVVSALSIYFVRPFVQKFIIKEKIMTNFDRVIGQAGVVTEEIDNDRPCGLIRVIGQDWTARSASGEIIPEGTHVRVRNVEGVKAFVEPLEAHKGSENQPVSAGRAK